MARHGEGRGLGRARHIANRHPVGRSSQFREGTGNVQKSKISLKPSSPYASGALFGGVLCSGQPHHEAGLPEVVRGDEIEERPHTGPSRTGEAMLAPLRRGCCDLSQVAWEPDFADVGLEESVQPTPGAIIDVPAVELVGDGHVLHDRGAQTDGEQRRPGPCQCPQDAPKMAIDRSQARFLEENICETVRSDHVFEEAVDLLVAIDVERPKRACVFQLASCPTTANFILNEADKLRLDVNVFQDAGRGIDEVVVDIQFGSGELEERDILSDPCRLEGVDGIIGGHDLGLPFQVAPKESVKDHHLEPIVGQVHAQEVQREVLVEPPRVQIVQQAPVGHAYKWAEPDPGDTPQGDHAADGAMPDDPIEIVLNVEVVPDRVLGRHLKMPHETEALQGDRIVEQNVPCGGQGVVVEVHDFLSRVHLWEHLAPRDVERENLVKRPRLKAKHGVIALDEPWDLAWMHGTLDDGVPTRVHEHFTTKRSGIALGVVLDRAQHVVERVCIEALLAHAPDNGEQAELVLGHDGAVVVDAIGRRLTGNGDEIHAYLLSGDWLCASPGLFGRLGGHFKLFEGDEVDADIQRVGDLQDVMAAGLAHVDGLLLPEMPEGDPGEEDCTRAKTGKPCNHALREREGSCPPLDPDLFKLTIVDGELDGVTLLADILFKKLRIVASHWSTDPGDTRQLKVVWSRYRSLFKVSTSWFAVDRVSPIIQANADMARPTDQSHLFDGVFVRRESHGYGGRDQGRVVRLHQKFPACAEGIENGIQDHDLGRSELHGRFEAMDERVVFSLGQDI